MSKKNTDPYFLRREAAIAGWGLGMMLTGVIGVMAAVEDFTDAREVWSERAAVKIDAPNEAAVRSELAAEATAIGDQAHANGLSGLGFLAVGGAVLYGAGYRWREAHPQTPTELYIVPLSVLGVRMNVGISPALRPDASRD